jgi:sugar lactone lactonase YvrE
VIATEAALVLDAQAELGEGPMWDPRACCLYFVDILRGCVHRFDPAQSAVRSYEVGRMVGAAVLTGSDDLMLAVQHGFARLDTRTGEVHSAAQLDTAHLDLRFNDGKCDPAGRLWAGTMALDERHGAGALYRLDPDGSLHRILDDVTISNGLDWSDAGTTMYFIDSPTRSIDVFEFDLTGGNIRNRRTFVRIPRGEGVPDGMTLDAEGYVWVALWGGGAVHRYAPDGRCDTVVRVPTRYPTSCAFGGSDLGDLYITTAHVKLTPQERAEQPQAGGIFVARPGPKGRPANRYGCSEGGSAPRSRP